jgi:hypothetical protein
MMEKHLDQAPFRLAPFGIPFLMHVPIPVKSNVIDMKLTKRNRNILFGILSFLIGLIANVIYKYLVYLWSKP